MSITLSGKEPHDRDGDHLCSSLCVGKDQHSFIVSLGHDGILQPAVSELSVTLPSSWDMKHWTELLQHFQQLRELKNKSEVDYNALDERVKNLVSLLHSLPGLQKVYLKANIQTIQWAFEVYSLIHKCATLQEIDVMVRELEEEHGEPAHSFLSVRKDQDSTVRLTVGQHILRPSLTPHENSPLSLISVTFPDSEVPSKRWVDFLKNFDTLSRNRTAHMEDLKEDIKGLFSTLLSVSGLREVELRVGNLTETWAQHIISLIRKQPRDKEISVNALKECGNQEESLCSSLYVTNKNSNFRLAVEHLSQGNSTPALSYISVVTDSHDKQMNQMDWTKYLKMFHTLKRELESVYVHEYAEPLLSVLRSLSALREVEFRVSCLTEVWAGLMLSLLQDCTGLQKMRLSAGRAVVSEGLSVCSEYGPLLLDNINHLKESLKDTHCTVTLIGIKRRTVEMSSHFREGRLQCNRPVKITIKGRKYTEELLDQ